MKERTSWRSGCGIGCAVILLLTVIVVGIGYFLLRDTVDALREIQESTVQMEEKVGNINDFVPEPTGSIALDRIETFLKVRANLVLAADKFEVAIDESLVQMRQAENDKSFREAWGFMKKGLGIVPRLATYFAERNRLLVQAGMNPGEYYYYYVILYYAWLEKSPGDGHILFSMSQHRSGQTQSFRLRMPAEAESDPQQIEKTKRRFHEDQRYHASRMINEVTLPMLQRQKKAMTEAPLTQDQISWSKALAQEIEAMEKKPDRLPWQDGVPTVITESLVPYRERLLQSYNQVLNLLEVVPVGQVDMQFEQ